MLTVQENKNAFLCLIEPDVQRESIQSRWQAAVLKLLASLPSPAVYCQPYQLPCRLGYTLLHDHVAGQCSGCRPHLQELQGFEHCREGQPMKQGLSGPRSVVQHNLQELPCGDQPHWDLHMVGVGYDWLPNAACFLLYRLDAKGKRISGRICSVCNWSSASSGASTLAVKLDDLRLATFLFINAPNCMQGLFYGVHIQASTSLPGIGRDRKKERNLTLENTWKTSITLPQLMAEVLLPV